MLAKPLLRNATANPKGTPMNADKTDFLLQHFRLDTLVGFEWKNER